MEFKDSNKFAEIQNNALTAMFQDNETNDFAQYFTSTYALRAQ